MKKNDKTLKSAPKDSGRETRVLLEDISKQVHIVAEGHGVIIKKLDEHGRKLDEHGRMLDEHGRKLDEHGRKLDEHGRKLDEHDGRFDRIESVLLDTNSRVKSIEKKLDNHEGRIIKLEEKVLA